MEVGPPPKNTRSPGSKTAPGASLGVVLQESFLFDGTIRENVAFSRPDATDEQIMRACKIARVDEFAESFADKYDTVVGERGVKLSGGQRQRISIARALLHDAPIVLLDEPTSELDAEAEQGVLRALRRLMRGRTVVMVTHRPALLGLADRVVELRDGRLVTPEPPSTTRLGLTGREAG